MVLYIFQSSHTSADSWIGVWPNERSIMVINPWFNKKRRAERSKLSHEIRTMAQDIAGVNQVYSAPNGIQGYLMGTIHASSGYETDQVLITLDGNVHTYSQETGKRILDLSKLELHALRELQLLMRKFLFPSE